jgi:hypothetical protein
MCKRTFFKKFWIMMNKIFQYPLVFRLYLMTIVIRYLHTQIQLVIVYRKTGFKCVWKDFCFINKSNHHQMLKYTFYLTFNSFIIILDFLSFCSNKILIFFPPKIVIIKAQITWYLTILLLISYLITNIFRRHTF